jgi:hypothetical protein
MLVYIINKKSLGFYILWSGLYIDLTKRYRFKYFSPPSRRLINGWGSNDYYPAVWQGFLLMKEDNANVYNYRKFLLLKRQLL